jgi:hypothetical protein
MRRNVAIYDFMVHPQLGDIEDKHIDDRRMRGACIEIRGVIVGGQVTEPYLLLVTYDPFGIWRRYSNDE